MAQLLKQTQYKMCKRFDCFFYLAVQKILSKNAAACLYNTGDVVILAAFYPMILPSADH